jgi:hypothetical protein
MNDKLLCSLDIVQVFAGRPRARFDRTGLDPPTGIGSGHQSLGRGEVHPSRCCSPPVTLRYKAGSTVYKIYTRVYILDLVRILADRKAEKSHVDESCSSGRAL